MRMRLFIGAGLLSGLTLLSMAEEPDSLYQNSLWDDGQAEVSLYEAAMPHYGQLYPSEVAMVWVKEPFRTDTRVKSDQPAGKNIEPVIKINTQISTRTGNYTYEQMHSGFWAVADGRSLKWTVSHHEACGASFKMGHPEEASLELTYHTYWDGEGDGILQMTLPENAWYYESLPYRLREYAAARSRETLSIHLFSPVIRSQLGEPAFRPATVIHKEELPHTVIEVRHHGGVDTLTFDRNFPHVLREWKQAGGGALRLIESTRTDYWNHHDLDDPPLIPGK